MNAKIEWSPQFVRKANRMLGRGGSLQKLVDGMIFESIEPYVPRDTGTLYRSAATSAAHGVGLIEWVGPQVRLLYHGILMVDPVHNCAGFLTPEGWRSRRGIRKIKDPKGRTFKYTGGGKRGAYWPQRWMNDNLVSFEKNIQKEANKLLHR